MMMMMMMMMMMKMMMMMILYGDLIQTVFIAAADEKNWVNGNNERNFNRFTGAPQLQM